MRWLKKILRIIAILLPCFVAMSITSPSFAKSYDVNTFPIALPNKDFLEPFNLQFSTTTFSSPHAPYFSSKIQDGHCVYDETHDAMYSSSSSLSYSFYYKFDSSDPLYLCMSLNRISSSDYSSIESSFPPAFSDIYNKWNRYWYLYDGFYVFDSYSEEGLNKRSKLSFPDLFGDSLPDSFTNMTIPLGLLNQESIISGTPIIVQGRYDLGPSEDGESADLDPNWAGQHFIRVKGFLDSTRYVNNSVSYFDIPCVLTTDWIADSQIATRSFYCSANSSLTFDSNYPVGFTFMSRLGNDTALWDMPSDFLTFDYINIILNNDITSGGNLNAPVSGGDPTKAPGSALNPNYNQDSQDDFFSSLVNQFVFSFTNPFQPIFNLFTSGDQCSQIPIIAGMLHSDQTTYCPWFDSSVRNILTPVFSLASVMLVFGFLVRWLGSSSGNMFDDETGGGALGKGTFVGRSRK